MKKLILFSFLFLSLNTSILYSQPQLEWVKSYRVRGQSLALDSSGNIILVGFRDSVICTIKYNSSGQIIWAEDTANHPDGQGIRSAVDKFGNIYIALENDNSQLELIKYDSSGHQKWNNHYFPESNRCHGIALDTSGNIFVICESYTGGHIGYLTVKYSPSGDIVWYKRYTVNYGARAPNAIYVDIPGNVYVTGGSNIDTIRYYDFATIKYNNDGVQQWISFYNGRISGWDKSNSVFADNNEFCYVTGYSDYTVDRKSYCTIKYNSAGDSVWTRLYPNDTTGELYIRDGSFVFADSPGNVFVAGWKYIVGSIYGWAITAMKYDKDGNLLWYKTDSGAMYSKSAILDKQSNLYVIGDGRGRMKGSGYDSSGNKIWDFLQSNNGYYNAVQILCNKNGDLYALSSSLDTAMLFKFSLPTGIRNGNTTLFKDFKLEQNYPNPFNTLSSIKYQVSRNSNVKLIIYNILGKEVETIVNKEFNAGIYVVIFDGKNLSSGIYFYRLLIDGKIIDTKKLLMIK